MANFINGYAEINGLRLYYEIHGKGSPLVLIHGGGSTIQTTFGRIIPLLTNNRQVIAVDLQAHGRSGDRDQEVSFEQDADDIAGLLQHLRIPAADFLGFSNGGTTALQITIRHPEIVNRIITIAALAQRSGMPEAFWDFMKNASLEFMPVQLQEAYKAVAPDPEKLIVMHDKDARRMVHFTDIPEEQLKAISKPVMIIIGDRDVILPEHAVALHRMISGARLVILPGAHGECIGEITTIPAEAATLDFPVLPLIDTFLKGS
ncbi:alpha/beta fold hydrolase [Flavihumibacter petaseus]|uniref:Putative hydrolase n=1 Tax=Flavihumibacter petaseus NBRC 106054 TaxID=1220578 RepID=A0A0E9N1S9_9BACT|nr:alpha/beta hydrolase [Flavihumibacter petaseus]GAO43586.1 putative hydrolase [Flavihumibacter petaseus NBRC 106054]